MPSIYCDKAKMCLNFDWCASCFELRPECELYVPLTNGERLKRASAEEKAVFLERVSGLTFRINGQDLTGDLLDRKAWKAWLQQPVDTEKCCLQCSHSMSADKEDGSQCLVCSEKDFAEVNENGFCYDFT